MTEEKIIDGVTVSECKLYDYGICDSEQVENLNCEQNPDCYFKQLKRLEQENKELKKQIEAQKGLITVGGKQQYEMTKAYYKCKTALEKIRELAKNGNAIDGIRLKIINKINEVLNDN